MIMMSPMQDSNLQARRRRILSALCFPSFTTRGRTRHHPHPKEGETSDRPNDHNTVASSHPGGSDTQPRHKKQLLITESRNTTPPGREPEPPCSVTFPWPGLTPQRSTRGATRDRDSNTQLNARDNHRASQARLKTIRDRSRRGRRPLSLRDIDNRIPREKERRRV